VVPQILNIDDPSLKQKAYREKELKMSSRFDAKGLIEFGKALLEKSELPSDRAAVVAEILVEVDLIGHTTNGEAFSIDISTSTTTNGMTQRLYEAGQHLSGTWLVDNQGGASNDPAVLFTNPPGAILSLGGLDLCHKTFALGMLVEVLTAGLGGFGRHDKPNRWGAAVFLQITTIFDIEYPVLWARSEIIGSAGNNIPYGVMD
jgi:LDH2 family malate/lactate/ureidoglycolate dehydrogenase